ncbi:hypothetical protein AB6A40_007518 [Gnathostoma spinigerum]|uniref:Palmitoyltransferase n=1 Tax=Gnathostoma spinigerum TaxID=75299 RepID=A0ABD6EU48_9BILA
MVPSVSKCADSCCVRKCISCIRWLPVVFILAIVFWAYYAYFVQLCFFTVESVIERAVYITVFHILFFIFLWTYYQTIFTPISKPPKSFYLPNEVKRELEAADSDAECRNILDRFVRNSRLPIANRNFDGGIRYCLKCKCVKPDRCHHCSICGQCVLKFDHHCPWVNTCVNFNNYKYFIQFLGSGLLLSLWTFFTDMKYFIGFWKVIIVGLTFGFTCYLSKPRNRKALT